VDEGDGDDVVSVTVSVNVDEVDGAGDTVVDVEVDEGDGEEVMYTM